MNTHFFRQLRRMGCIVTAFFFIINSTASYAQVAGPMPWMPEPGSKVSLTGAFTPAYLKGMAINSNEPFKFDFIINRGDEPFQGDARQAEYQKLIKYFLAALATPDTDQWVNLSPYEKDRIIPDDFGLTEMGRDVLAQDYLLKQLSASLTDPDSELGKKFWDNVYATAHEKFGSTEIPTDMFNKVWITPDKALIYEKGNTAFVLKSHLKVMLETDYLAQNAGEVHEPPLQRESVNVGPWPRRGAVHEPPAQKDIAQQVMREVIIPAIEKEVNEGKSFAPLRQVYSGMLLATWYKVTLQKSILGKLYADQGKVKGIDQDPAVNQKIFNQYVAAFRKGVVNMIKEDVDRYSQEVIPRKYFSGGFVRDPVQAFEVTRLDSDAAQEAAQFNLFDLVKGVFLSILAGRDGVVRRVNSSEAEIAEAKIVIAAVDKQWFSGRLLWSWMGKAGDILGAAEGVYKPGVSLKEDGPVYFGGTRESTRKGMDALLSRVQMQAEKQVKATIRQVFPQLSAAGRQSFRNRIKVAVVSNPEPRDAEGNSFLKFNVRLSVDNAAAAFDPQAVIEELVQISRGNGQNGTQKRQAVAAVVDKLVGDPQVTVRDLAGLGRLWVREGQLDIIVTDALSGAPIAKLERERRAVTPDADVRENIVLPFRVLRRTNPWLDPRFNLRQDAAMDSAAFQRAQIEILGDNYKDMHRFARWMAKNSYFPAVRKLSEVPDPSPEEFQEFGFGLKALIGEFAPLLEIIIEKTAPDKREAKAGSILAAAFVSIQETQDVLGVFFREVDQLPETVRGDIQTAVSLVFEAQGKNFRKDFKFYPIHPLQVALNIITSFGITDRDIIITAITHDFIEDVPVTEAMNPAGTLEKLFGLKVRANVQALTNKVLSPEEVAWTEGFVRESGFPEEGVVKMAETVVYQPGVMEELEKDPAIVIVKSSDFGSNALQLAGLAKNPELQGRLAGKYGLLVAVFAEKFLELAAKEEAKGANANQRLIDGLRAEAKRYQEAEVAVAGYIENWSLKDAFWAFMGGRNTIDPGKPFANALVTMKSLAETMKKPIAERASGKKDAAQQQGGIDLNAANLDMQIKRDGAGIVLPVEQQDLQNIHIDGLVPVILDIQPASASPVFAALRG